MTINRTIFNNNVISKRYFEKKKGKKKERTRYESASENTLKDVDIPIYLVEHHYGNEESHKASRVCRFYHQWKTIKNERGLRRRSACAITLQTPNLADIENILNLKSNRLKAQLEKKKKIRSIFKYLLYID